MNFQVSSGIRKKEHETNPNKGNKREEEKNGIFDRKQ